MEKAEATYQYLEEAHGNGMFFYTGWEMQYIKVLTLSQKARKGNENRTQF